MTDARSAVREPVPRSEPFARRQDPVRGRFPSPFEVLTPPGAEGWQELYSYSLPFSEERREYEENQFWFLDGVHWPTVLTPFDATFLQYAASSLSQFNNRHYLIPTAQGVDYRILNGYGYLTAVEVCDPQRVQARMPHFVERAGHYYEHWDELYDRWLVKVKALIGRLEAVSFPVLPERVDLDVVTSGAGRSHPHDLMRSYHELVDLGLELWQYHFEFLNLGYVAYLDFFAFCKDVFPDVPDLSVARMVAGVDVDLFRPDEELRILAAAAVDLDVDEALLIGSVDQAFEAVAARPGGAEWLARFDAAKYPWFNYSNGSGFLHTDAVWADHLEVPLSFIRGYIRQLRAGESIERPKAAVLAERDRVTAAYRDLLEDEDREAFDQKLGLARNVFHYVENHNFYVEHWGHAVFWRKMRDLSSVLVAEGFWDLLDDIFFLRREEVAEVLWDACSAWAVGSVARGPRIWPAEIARRREIIRVLGAWSPPPGLGVPPEQVTEPFTVMLWGITNDSVARWLGTDDEDDSITGFAASPGVAEGNARVVHGGDEIGEVEDGEVLVAQLTAPSWSPIFRRVAATVTDSGGMMSHAAIVCREYGLPAVTGTAFATTRIKTGMRLRVDGSNGTVTVLSDG